MDGLQQQLSRRRLAAGCAAIALTIGAACGRDASARGPETTIDSVVPREVALERFRDGLPEVTALAGGAPSREALVRGFASALAAGDAATLRGLALDRAEFAWLYYPTTPQGLPPYDLSPGLLWSLLDLHGERGLRRALEEHGGKPARYLGHSCDPRAGHEGVNTVYGPCVVRLTVAGERIEQRLFGLILERGGRFKFVSLANTLD